MFDSNTTTKHDVERVNMSYIPLPNIILTSSFILFYLYSFHLFCYGIVTKYYLKNNIWFLTTKIKEFLFDKLTRYFVFFYLILMNILKLLILQSKVNFFLETFCIWSCIWLHCILVSWRFHFLIFLFNISY